MAIAPSTLNSAPNCKSWRAVLLGDIFALKLSQNVHNIRECCLANPAAKAMILQRRQATSFARAEGAMNCKQIHDPILTSRFSASAHPRNAFAASHCAVLL